MLFWPKPDLLAANDSFPMNYGIHLKVSGDYALFSRPEMKVERVSYDVMTPSAARGILEGIYWKPQIRWIIDEIHVLNPIRFTNIRRNEVASEIPVRGGTGVNAAMANPEIRPEMDVAENRQQRASLLLKDVAYVIKAHVLVLDARVEKGKAPSRRTKPSASTSTCSSGAPARGRLSISRTSAAASSRSASSSSRPRLTFPNRTHPCTGKGSWVHAP